VVCPEPHSPDLPNPEFFAQMTKGDPQREMSEGVNATKGEDRTRWKPPSLLPRFLRALCVSVRDFNFPGQGSGGRKRTLFPPRHRDHGEEMA